MAVRGTRETLASHCGGVASSTSGRWGRRAAVWAFCFFLVKGLVWLAVPVVVACYAGM
ncbi:MAG: hypothetical protein U0637_10430 [Phycisphaerales bacterium]